MKDETHMMGSAHGFPQTRWDLVFASRDLQSLSRLVELYWKPVYFFVRLQGFDNETAKDIVQEFLTTLLERDAFSKADPARGRFRTFLLTALSNFLKDWSKAASRQKRGGGERVFSLDFTRGEEEFAREVTAGASPEMVMNRTWAHTLLEQALKALKGDPAHLQAFRLYLADRDYNGITEETGLTEAAAKMAVHRLKDQLKGVIEGYLRSSGTPEEDLKSELAEFLSLLR